MCNCGGKKSPVVAKMLRSPVQSGITAMRVPDNQEVVTWGVQPSGVTLYTGESGTGYRVRNKGEEVVILRADRPLFERMGYISPKEQ